MRTRPPRAPPNLSALSPPSIPLLGENLFLPLLITVSPGDFFHAGTPLMHVSAACATVGAPSVSLCVQRPLPLPPCPFGPDPHHAPAVFAPLTSRSPWFDRKVFVPFDQSRIEGRKGTASGTCHTGNDFAVDCIRTQVRNFSYLFSNTLGPAPHEKDLSLSSLLRSNLGSFVACLPARGAKTCAFSPVRDPNLLSC